MYKSKMNVLLFLIIPTILGTIITINQQKPSTVSTNNDLTNKTSINVSFSINPAQYTNFPAVISIQPTITIFSINPGLRVVSSSQTSENTKVQTPIVGNPNPVSQKQPQNSQNGYFDKNYIQSCAQSPAFNTSKIFSKTGESKKITINYQDYINTFKPKNSAFSITQSSSDISLGRATQSNIQIARYRQLIFNNNLNQINSHNQINNRSYNMGLNQFTDMQKSQFVQKYATLIIPAILKQERNKKQTTYTLKPQQKASNPLINQLKPAPTPTPAPTPKSTPTSTIALNPNPINTNSFIPNPNPISPSPSANNSSARPRLLSQKNDLPNITINWRCKVLSTVYAQGQCGSCYAISSLDAIFISINIRKTYYLPFSIQQILSCAKNDITLLGCRGGYFQDVYQYVRKYGVGPAAYYPYHKDAQYKGKNVSCSSFLINSKSYITSRNFIRGNYRIPSGDCRQLIQILKTQAVSVAIATGDNLQFYSDGTFVIESNQNNGAVSAQINHGVTLIGYDYTNGFLIKNSWGNTWGKFGYGYVGKDSGICQFAVAPIL